MAALGGKVLTIAERYAGALFDLARERGQIETVERNLLKLEAALQQSIDLRRLAANPIFSPDDQHRGLAGVFSSLGIDGITRDFFAVLVKNRRLFAAEPIISAFKALASRERGEIKAEIISATALTEAQRESLSDALRQKLGKSPKSTLSVDPKLLGGLVVRVGSQMFDTSLRTKLKHLENAMKEAR